MGTTYEINQTTKICDNYSKCTERKAFSVIYFSESTQIQITKRDSIFSSRVWSLKVGLNIFLQLPTQLFLFFWFFFFSNLEQRQ